MTRIIDVMFRNRWLQRNFEESDRTIRQWGKDVGCQYIIRVAQLHAVPDFQTAGKIRALKLHPLKVNKQGRWSIRLTGRWRLIVAEGSSEEHVVIEGGSNHYDQ